MRDTTRGLVIGYRARDNRVRRSGVLSVHVLNTYTHIQAHTHTLAALSALTSYKYMPRHKTVADTTALIPCLLCPAAAPQEKRGHLGWARCGRSASCLDGWTQRVHAVSHAVSALIPSISYKPCTQSSSTATSPVPRHPSSALPYNCFFWVAG